MASKAVTTVQPKAEKSAKGAKKKDSKIVKPKVVQTPKGKEILVQPIHPSARLYGQVIIDPFSVTEGVAQPFGDPVKSSKEVYFAKGELQLGTTGYGFLLFKPSCASDYACISHTTATSIGGSTTQLDAFTDTQVAYPVGCPYTQASFASGSSLVSRYVGGGLRAKYMGKLLDRNGISTAVEEPDGLSVENYSIADLQNTDWTRTKAISDKEWDAKVNSSGPFHPDHYSFRGGSNGISPLGVDFNMGFVFKGVAGDTFWWECKYYVELAGKGPPAKSMTVPCIQQGQMIHAAAKTITGTQGTLAPNDHESFWSKVKNFIGDNLPMIIEGTKAIGAGVVAAVTRSPQALAIAANSIGNMITPSSGPLKLTETQRKILAAYPHVVAKQPHLLRSIGDVYDTPWSVMGMVFFEFILVKVEAPSKSISKPGSVGSGLYFLPRPIVSKFINLTRDPLIGKDAEMASIMYDIAQLGVGDVFPYMDPGEYDDWCSKAQQLLDLKLNQTPPMSPEEMERDLRMKEERAKVEEFIPKIGLHGWIILKDKGFKTFADYVRMVYGDDTYEVVQTEYFKQRAESFTVGKYIESLPDASKF